VASFIFGASVDRDKIYHVVKVAGGGSVVEGRDIDVVSVGDRIISVEYGCL
jgi:hypothetical protein